MIIIRVQNFGRRLIYAECNGSRNVCDVNHPYVTGKLPPNYPVPAIPLDVMYDERGEAFIVRNYVEGFTSYWSEVPGYTESY